MVVGNKVDLPRAVRPELGRAAARYLGAPQIETSALTGEGVASLFETLATLAARSRFGVPEGEPGFRPPSHDSG